MGVLLCLSKASKTSLQQREKCEVDESFIVKKYLSFRFFVNSFFRF